ncbi:MAG: SRPBCC family protein [Actinobacteria bacterium]|nr:SRPBCC family protein [Actinomycetota bacterium]
MPLIEESIHIDRPRDEVWAFMINPENQVLWQGSLIDFQYDDPEPKVGNINKGTVRVAGKKMHWTAEITEIEDGRIWATKSIEAPVEFMIRTTLEDAGEGTKVTFRNESGSLRGFFGKLTDPLVVKLYTRDVQSDLAKLKELLEAGVDA